MNSPLGDVYVTINEDDKHQPFEVFATLGKAGSIATADAEAIGRLISLALRFGIPVGEVVQQLRGISSDRAIGFGQNKVLSVPDALGQAIAESVNALADRLMRDQERLAENVESLERAYPDAQMLSTTDPTDDNLDFTLMERILEGIDDRWPRAIGIPGGVLPKVREPQRRIRPGAVEQDGQASLLVSRRVLIGERCGRGQAAPPAEMPPLHFTDAAAEKAERAITRGLRPRPERAVKRAPSTAKLRCATSSRRRRAR